MVHQCAVAELQEASAAVADSEAVVAAVDSEAVEEEEDSVEVVTVARQAVVVAQVTLNSTSPTFVFIPLNTLMLTDKLTDDSFPILSDGRT